MELFLMSLTTGIMVGGIYALVALGWVLIYKCSGVLNLAMGELTLIGAYVTYTFHAIGVPFVPAVILTLLVGIVLGFLTERIFLDKLIGEPILAVIMVTGIWLLMIFTTKTMDGVVNIGIIQLLMTISYADYRASVVRKELSQEMNILKFKLKAMEQAKNL